MDTDKQNGHGHEHGIDIHHEHGDGQAPWMRECRNADEKFSPASLVFR
jgi:hypothetical protein